MAQKYRQTPNLAGATRFNKAPMSGIEFSRMVAVSQHLTTFNGGDIVPVYYAEVLPHDTFSVDLDFVMRLSTSLRPTMGNLQVDYYAYFVPNRVVNDSWKNVQGENTSGVWSAPEVDLAPLYVDGSKNPVSAIQVPVGSVADYYGFPTQAPIQTQHLKVMNDLKFRGYLEIYNNYFRDQNYQPPIPYSKLNVYEGFFEEKGTLVSLKPNGEDIDNAISVPGLTQADGSYGAGAIVKGVYGEGANNNGYSFASESLLSARLTSWSALDKPLKANKLHDAFTSALPSPQKGSEVYFGVAETAPVELVVGEELKQLNGNIRLGSNGQALDGAGTVVLGGNGLLARSSYESVGTISGLDSTNLKGIADLSTATGISVNDLRTAIATQQVYEILARGGSRYSSVIANMFGIETANPFMDIPLELGHIRRELDMYQVAQTSASVEGETAQGSLTAFGYTTNGGKLFERTFIEHGYIHIMAVVRQKNVYSTYLAPDNFRLNTLDFYLPPLANIGEQPIALRTLNPFVEDDENKVLGYQEAWWEYRFEPDRVSGEMRSGITGSQDVWHYGDFYDPNFTHVNGDWLKSNAQEVIDRTIAVTSELAHQFRSIMVWKVDKQRPMPIYSIPGLDTI